jgi:peptidyl-prolyl cis-trans isomerase C
MVLDELVNQTLLAQAAFNAGFTLDDAALQQRVDQLMASLGGQVGLDAWIATQGYTPASFLSSLKRAAASAWQRDDLINAVPQTAEQVRAQQILVRSEDTAASIHRQLEAGADFATLAQQYDPVTGGILGWFPRGYLTQPAVEEAAFALQPGQFSPVVQTDFGYHIIFVIERQADHMLSADARSVMQHKALDAWLSEQRNSAAIQVLLP